MEVSGVAGVAFAVAVAFYAAIEQKFNSLLAGRPVAVIQGGRVLDLSPEIRAMGIGPGIKRPNLLALCPEACLVPYEEERYEEGWRQLLDLCAAHVPAVEPAGITQAFLDVVGLDHSSVCRRLGREARARLGVSVVFGLGPTKLVARAAGLELAGRGTLRPGEVLAVTGGEDEARAFLDPLPVTYLYPFPPEVPARLERLGFGRLQEVRNLPVEELARQFGWTLARRIAAAAAGGEPDSVRAAWPPPSLSVTGRFAGGLAGREALEQVLRETAGRLAREMGSQGLACGEVSLTFRGEDGHRREVARRLTRPGRSPATLGCALSSLAERLLEGWPGADPPVELEARAGRVLPRAAGQLALWGDVPSPGSVPEVVKELAWRFGGKVIGDRNAADGGAYQRLRREDLLVYYDPLRAGVRSGDG